VRVVYSVIHSQRDVAVWCVYNLQCTVYVEFLVAMRFLYAFKSKQRVQETHSLKYFRPTRIRKKK